MCRLLISCKWVERRIWSHAACRMRMIGLQLIKIGIFIEWSKSFFVILLGLALASFTEEWRLLPWNMALVDVTKSCIDSIRQVCLFFFWWWMLNCCSLKDMLFESYFIIYSFACECWILPYKYPMQRLCLLLVQHIP